MKLRCLLPALGLVVMAAAQADDGAELTLRADQHTASMQGPLAAADVLQPGVAPPPPSSARLQLELRQSLRLVGAVSLSGNVLLAHERQAGGAGQDHSRVNELVVGVDGGAWQWTAGRKVLGWDVGYAFRPNDVVQQEVRRTQLGQTSQGRPLLQLEHFGDDRALALVLVHPQHLGRDAASSRGAEEAALAARIYGRLGALDLHGFARQGRHTGASAGAALSWVASDAVELHASARAFQRHDGWSLAADTADAAVRANPWQQASLPGGTQWLVGGQWTGGPQLNLLVEAWHDGTALSDAAWRDWGTRNAALARLATQGPQRAAAAGNLAWQAAPFDSASLRRDNLFLRLAWQPVDWTVSVDALLTPADRGHVFTAAVQWKGERWRLDASWRVFGGPAAALYSQLPSRRSALLAATWAF